MSLPSHLEQLVTIRDEARVLVQCADDHEDQVQALVAAADSHVRHAEEALSDALAGTQRSVEHLLFLLSAQLRKSQDDADTARALCAGAHEQRTAAGILLTHLDRDIRAASQMQLDSRRDAVLVVDDHGQVREVIAEVLRGAGFVVRTAANGLEGLLAAYEMLPAVIVMDLAMPVLDGIEATRLIKATEATRQARVIAYTGNAQLDSSLMQTLFTAVVRKPATPADLLATVQQVARL
ncbi:MAG: response regulator [Vicinamibacterales bacterium]